MLPEETTVRSSTTWHTWTTTWQPSRRCSQTEREDDCSENRCCCCCCCYCCKLDWLERCWETVVVVVVVGKRMLLRDDGTDPEISAAMTNCHLKSNWSRNIYCNCSKKLDHFLLTRKISFVYKTVKLFCQVVKLFTRRCCTEGRWCRKLMLWWRVWRDVLTTNSHVVRVVAFLVWKLDSNWSVET